MWVAVYIFGCHVVVSVLVSMVAEQGTFNDQFFGMPLPLAVIAIGVAAFLFLAQRVKVEAWVWQLLIGSFGSNLFERLAFGSVFDWIPCGVGFCNTADLGIMVGLFFLFRGTLENAIQGREPTQKRTDR